MDILLTNDIHDPVELIPVVLDHPELLVVDVDERGGLVDAAEELLEHLDTLGQPLQLLLQLALQLRVALGGLQLLGGVLDELPLLLELRLGALVAVVVLGEPLHDERVLGEFGRGHLGEVDGLVAVVGAVALGALDQVRVVGRRARGVLRVEGPEVG